MQRWILVILACVMLVDCAENKLQMVYNSIYTTMIGAPCVRLLWRGGVVGCGGPDSSHAGTLFLIQHEEDLREFLYSKELPSMKFVVAMDAAFFNVTTLQLLGQVSQFTALLVLHSDAPASGFSPDDASPLQRLSVTPNEYPWNQNGNAMMYEAFEYPIFALNATESSTMIAGALANRQATYSYPVWTVDFEYFMHATNSSFTCLRRNTCGPVGGMSVWGTLGGPVQQQKQAVFITAALDSASFFHDLALGSDADVSGVVAVMAAVDALSKLPNLASLPRQIVFAAFNAEAWGYYGSARFFQDISTPFVCTTPPTSGDGCSRPYQSSLEFTKLSTSRVAAAIDMRQVGHYTAESLYVHYNRMDGTIIDDNLAEDVVEVARSSAPLGTGIRVDYATAPASAGIPPTSLNPLFNLNNNAPGVILTDHAKNFVNKYYNSEFDGSANTRADTVCRAATVLARAAYGLAATSASRVNISAIPSTLAADCNLTTTLMTCLVDDFGCAEVQKYLGATPSGRTSHYASVFRFGFVSPIPKFVHDFLSTRTIQSSNGAVCGSTKGCDTGMTCVAGVCVVANTYYHDAYSTAITYNYDKAIWELTGTDTNDAAWTESNWMATGLRLYQRNSGLADGFVLGMGIVTCAFSFAIGHLAKRFYLQRLKIA